MTPDGKTMYCVREDHADPHPSRVVNEVVAVDLDSGDMEVVATGNDFYAAPRLSPDGRRVAYVTWNHPSMPWDATELRVVDLGGGGKESGGHELVAGEDGDTSVIQPAWSTKTGDLYYISDETGYYNLYRAGTEGTILPMEHDLGGSAPGWALGQQGYAFLDDGRVAASYSKDGRSVLLVADVGGDGKAVDVVEYGSDDGLPMMFGGVTPGGEGGVVYLTGGSPSTPTSVYRWDMERRDPATILACSSSLSFPEGEEFVY